MTTRNAVSLFAFLMVTVGSLHVVAGTDKAPATPVAGSKRDATSSAGSKVIAYYFHVNARCTTCRTIEAYSHETITKNFGNDIDRGRLEWKVVNVQQPENKHFVQEYQLFTKSVVLVHFSGGKQQSYKTLNDVWTLVGEKAQFQSYVDKEVRAYLAKL